MKYRDIQDKITYKVSCLYGDEAAENFKYRMCFKALADVNVLIKHISIAITFMDNPKEREMWCFIQEWLWDEVYN